MNILLHAAEGSHASGIGQHVHYLGKGLLEEGFNVKYVFGRDSSKNFRGYQDFLPRKFTENDFILSPFLFRKFVDKKEFDMIHSHAQSAYNTIFWYPDKNATTLHGTDHGVYEQYKFETNTQRIKKDMKTKLQFEVTLYKETFAHTRTKSLISVSNGVALEAAKFFKKDSDIALNGVDCEEFNPDVENIMLRDKLGITRDQIMILFIGQTDWRKGLGYLTSALEGLNLGYTLVLGGLPYKYRQKNIISLGFLNHKLKRDLYQSCDIFCLPSLYEGMPLVMLEAMACAKPCLLTDVNGTDIITDYKDGIIVKKRDIQGIRAGLEYLSDKTVREEIGSRAIETAKRYPWSDMVKATINAYEKAKLI